MISRRTAIRTLTGLAFAPTLVRSAGAAPSPDEAPTLVKQLSEDAIKLLTGKDVPADERNRRFRQLLTKGFDVPGMGRFVLGRYWRDATEPEHEEYQKLFEDFIVATYAQRFSNYQGETLQIQGSNPEDGGKTVAVHSQIMRVNPPQPIKVDWRVEQTDQGWRIVDVVVEGVSLAVTQRSEFASVIQRNGGKISALLDTLKQKTSELRSTSG
jgi:phospholipid transport system substrate-binding protein